VEDFLKEMANILDEDYVEGSDRLEKFGSWDSLAILSVIALADERFGKQFSAQEIKRAQTVQALFDLISDGKPNAN